LTMKNYKEYIVLIITLLVATALRFHNLGETSLGNDELSSIVRAQYPSFHQLYHEGIKTDVHPAGLQVFLYYWIKIAGTSPFAVRLPFAICGVLSVLFAFLIARRWFNSTAALFTAAAMAALQFPLLYSQVARMYSIGLFFCLVNIWCWNKIIFPVDKEERKQGLYYALYVLSALLVMYLHYFSLMFIGVVGITGFFFLKRKPFIKYLLVWIAILALYIPAIPLLLEQLKLGGLEDWLAKPGSNTIVKYLFYCFNDSEILTSVIFAIPVLCIIFLGSKIKFTRFQFISFLWFIVPYSIAYYYSIYRQPVLQYSGLLFSFPMLLLFIFSFLPDRKITVVVISAVLLLLGGVTASTVAEKKFYSTPHFGVFKELAENVVRWEKTYGENNITKVFTLITPKYIDYYFERMNNPVTADLNMVNERDELAKLESLLDTCKTEYLLYAWSNIRHYYETLELITEKYPLVVERDTFFNSEITLFRRSNKLTDSAAFEVKGNYQDTSSAGQSKEFITILYKNINELNLQDDNIVTAEVQIDSQDSLKDVMLVVGYESYGENTEWNGMPVKTFYTSPGKWQRIILSAKVPDERNSLLKVYLWNPSKRNFSIGDYRVVIKKKNPLYRII
jgi:hypothetical protein